MNSAEDAKGSNAGTLQGGDQSGLYFSQECGRNGVESDLVGDAQSIDEFRLHIQLLEHAGDLNSSAMNQSELFRSHAENSIDGTFRILQE
jgi:hypothetical protein